MKVGQRILSVSADGFEELRQLGLLRYNAGRDNRDIRLLSERGGYNGQPYAGTDELCDEVQPIREGYTGDSVWVRE